MTYCVEVQWKYRSPRFQEGNRVRYESHAALHLHYSGDWLFITRDGTYIVSWPLRNIRKVEAWTETRA